MARAFSKISMDNNVEDNYNWFQELLASLEADVEVSTFAFEAARRAFWEHLIHHEMLPMLDEGIIPELDEEGKRLHSHFCDKFEELKDLEDEYSFQERRFTDFMSDAEAHFEISHKRQRTA